MSSCFSCAFSCPLPPWPSCRRFPDPRARRGPIRAEVGGAFQVALPDGEIRRFGVERRLAALARHPSARPPRPGRARGAPVRRLVPAIWPRARPPAAQPYGAAGDGRCRPTSNNIHPFVAGPVINLTTRATVRPRMCAAKSASPTLPPNRASRGPATARTSLSSTNFDDFTFLWLGGAGVRLREQLPARRRVLSRSGGRLHAQRTSAVSARGQHRGQRQRHDHHRRRSRARAICSCCAPV